MIVNYTNCIPKHAKTAQRDYILKAVILSYPILPSSQSHMHIIIMSPNMYTKFEHKSLKVSVRVDYTNPKILFGRGKGWGHIDLTIDRSLSP